MGLPRPANRPRPADRQADPVQGGKDLVGVARMCGVSRARVSAVVSLLGMARAEKERALGHTPSTQGSDPCCSDARSNALAGRAKNSNAW